MGPNSNTPKIERNPNSGTSEYGASPNRLNVANQTTHNVIRPVGEVARLRNEQLLSAESLAQPMQAMPTPTVVSLPTQAKVNPIASSASSDPAAAQDSDQIEKEWVDQTKKVIKITKSDPYEQARQVSLIMRDYVKKRYGREIGKAPEI